MRSCEIFQAVFSIQMTSGSDRVKGRAEFGCGEVFHCFVKAKSASRFTRRIFLDIGLHSDCLEFGRFLIESGDFPIAIDLLDCDGDIGLPTHIFLS